MNERIRSCRNRRTEKLLNKKVYRSAAGWCARCKGWSVWFCALRGPDPAGIDGGLSAWSAPEVAWTGWEEDIAYKSQHPFLPPSDLLTCLFFTVGVSVHLWLIPHHHWVCARFSPQPLGEVKVFLGRIRLILTVFYRLFRLYGRRVSVKKIKADARCVRKVTRPIDVKSSHEWTYVLLYYI